jgi:hypothetical protein
MEVFLLASSPPLFSSFARAGKITLAPTGKKFTMTGVNFWRIVDGKVVEKEGVYDQLGFFKQLSVIKYTEKARGLFPEEVS